MKSRIASIILSTALSLGATAQGLVEDPTVAAAVTADMAVPGLSQDVRQHRGACRTDMGHR